MAGFSFLFLLFITYSILGWIVESIYCSLYEKKVVNRGFLIGPYCPIYGAAAILIIIALSDFKNKILILFFLSTLLCGFLEYITSIILEKVFKLSLWDYSKEKLNIKGRICLKNLLMFGFLSVFLVELVHPFFEKLYSNIPYYIFIIIFVLTSLLFIADIIFTSIAVFDITNLANKTFNLNELSLARSRITDNILQDIESKAEKIKFELKDKKEKGKVTINFIHRRFIKAFPNIKSLNPNESFEILKNIINKYRK
ncbi:putative ABC transporter permease [Miniphocaeibacter massiliensis]|uniref:putative ABC transporter permease n=1 Tax=Miniphocaeibacter massiliensis TaxID=2041841 RepID=UPI000C1C7F32|nr:putative ABC transporter permease [Miniphocaeibacter massiliensis]